MTRDTDRANDDETDADENRRLDGSLLSDLSVNAVPIVIIGVFVIAFGVLSGESGPLLLFHGALIGGVVLLSVVAGWVITQEDGELRGSAADDCDTE